MATNTEVGVKITVDGGQATAETKKLRDNVEQLKNELRDLVEGTDEYEKKLKEVNEAQKKLDKSNDDVAKGLEKTTKGTKSAEGGFKSMGNALKSLGIITIIIEAFNVFKEALGRNQKVADTFSAVMTTITNVFSEFITIVTDVIDRVGKSSNGFEALGKVLKGLYTVGIAPLKIAFDGIVLAINYAQLAWEKSFFGDDDPETIKNLNERIAETKQSLVDTGSATLQAGKDIVNNIGQAATEVSQVVSGVVEGASKISVKGIYEQAKATTALKNTAKIAEAQLQGLVEKYDRQAEQQRQIRDNENLSIKDRIAANNKLGEVLQEQAKAQLALADKSIAAAKAELSANRGNVDLQAALIQAQNERAGILAQITGLESEQKVNAVALNKELVELEKARNESSNQLAIDKKKVNAELIVDELQRIKALRDIAKEETDIELNRLKAVIDSTNEGTQARVDAEIAYNTKKQELEIQTNELEAQISTLTFNREKDKLNVLIENDRLSREIRLKAITDEEILLKDSFDKKIITEAEYNAQLKSLSNSRKQIDESEAEKKIENAQKIGGAITQLGGLFAQETVAAKAAAIAAATIDTYAAAWTAFKQAQKNPISIIGPAYPYIQAGLAIAGGIANIRKIIAVKTPAAAGGGGSASVPSGGAPSVPSAPLAPQAETTIINQAQVNQIGNVAARAYVVESDVSGNQQRIQRLERAARIA